MVLRQGAKNWTFDAAIWESGGPTEGRVLEKQSDGTYGYDKWTGIAFFNANHTGVVDQNGWYMGNSYHTYEFVKVTMPFVSGEKNPDLGWANQGG